MNINVTENVSLIILNDVPADLCFTASVFKALAFSGINVDMISQAPPKGKTSSLSFTLDDADFGEAIKVIAKLREAHPDIKSAVSSSNSKITVSDEAMQTTPGMAAAVFSAVSETDADIRLITTSETEISVLVTETDCQKSVDNINRFVKL